MLMLKDSDVQAIRRFLQQMKDAADGSIDSHVAAHLLDRIVAAEHGYKDESNVATG